MNDRRHRWSTDVVRLAAEDQPDGVARTERACERCGVIKITVHPPEGFPWQEWRLPSGDKWPGAGRPLCLPVAEKVAA